MASSVEEFRRLLFRSVVLPSGLSVEIRKVQQWDLMGAEELPMPRGGEGEQSDSAVTHEQVRYLKMMTDRIIMKGTVSPSIIDLIDDQGAPLYLPDKLHISELTQNDYVALAQYIKEWCGLTQEDGQAVEAFRTDAERSAGESPRGTVSLPTV